MIDNVIKIVQAFDRNFNLVDKKRNEVRYINGNYYIPGESCIQMEDGKFHRVNNGKIFFDHSTQKWQFGKDNLSHGVVGRSAEGELIIGYYSDIKEEEPFRFFNKEEDAFEKKDLLIDYISDRTTIVRPRRSGNSNEINSTLDALPSEPSITKIINAEVAEQLKCVEDLGGEGWVYSPNKEDYSTLKKIFSKKKKAQYSVTSLPYNLDEPSSIKDEIISNFNTYTPEINPDDFDVRLSNIIKDLSFGLEIETSVGHIPKRILSKTGLVPLRDGSVSGIEYTTVPLKGINGLNTLRHIYHHINRRCEVDEHCSLHIHFGGMPRTKEYMLTLFSLAYRLQGELFEIVPPYKRSLKYWTSKHGGPKDHCKPLPGLALNTQRLENITGEERVKLINSEFGKLWKFVTSGSEENEEYNFNTKRFSGSGARKWNIPSRYYWLNFYPYLFGSGTLEFRLHQATLDYNVMMYWMLICASILNYCKDNADKILNRREKITLYDVILPIAKIDEEIYVKLMAYIDHRMTVFTEDRYSNIFNEIKRTNANTGDYPKLLKNVLQRQSSPGTIVT